MVEEIKSLFLEVRRIISHEDIVFQKDAAPSLDCTADTKIHSVLQHRKIRDLGVLGRILGTGMLYGNIVGRDFAIWQYHRERFWKKQ
jgi:hypothetical protein